MCLKSPYELLRASSFRTTRQMGVPRVLPVSLSRPDSTSTASSSLLGVTSLLCPGRLRRGTAGPSAPPRGIPGGQPSTPPPTAGPWLSPNVVTAKTCPNVLAPISHPYPVRAAEDCKGDDALSRCAHGAARRR